CCTATGSRHQGWFRMNSGDLRSVVSGDVCTTAGATSTAAALSPGATPPIATAEQFFKSLGNSGLLGDRWLEQLAREMRSGSPHAQPWADDLVRRGWLTAYQAEQLLRGHGERLVLGQYRILDRIGAGGMGQVFKAEHTLMKRLVALKVVGSVFHEVPREESGTAPGSAIKDWQGSFLRE